MKRPLDVNEFRILVPRGSTDFIKECSPSLSYDFQNSITQFTVNSKHDQNLSISLKTFSEIIRFISSNYAKYEF